MLLKAVSTITLTLLLIACQNRKGTLQGLWEINSLAFDGKEPFTHQDSYYDRWSCGKTSYTLTIEVLEGYIAFTKDQQYQLYFRYSKTITDTSENCSPYERITIEQLRENGFWTFSNRKTLYLQPEDKDPYECSVQKLVGNYLALDCSRKIIFYVYPYDRTNKALSESFQIKSTKIGK